MVDNKRKPSKREISIAKKISITNIILGFLLLAYGILLYIYAANNKLLGLD